MNKTITSREANQAFARCLREVEAGTEYIITRNGPAACADRRLAGFDGAAKEAALARTCPHREGAGQSAPVRSMVEQS
jgi:antitoxin (DNA-binding transcriptional repressor) of toxin-antitoxin stability system